MRTRLVATVLAVASGLWTPCAQAQHEGDMLIASTADGGGSLAVAYDFSSAIVVTKSFGAGGVTLYSGTEPGFDALLDDRPGDGLYVVEPDTTVRCEITAIDNGVSLQINGTTIDGVGESAQIGTAPSLHVHPIWRLTLPDGVVGDYRVTFRLTGTHGYQPSDEYTAILTNDSGSAASPSPTSTAMPEPTASATPVPTETMLLATVTPPPTATQANGTATPTPDAGDACPGDCNGDDRVAVNELIAAVNIALGNSDPGACPSVDANGDDQVSISELVRAVSAALDGCRTE